MPLRTTSDHLDPSALNEISEQYLLFYSSRDADGRLWCGDCRVVDPLVQETFGKADGPSALIVYVGQQADWQRPAHGPQNYYRGEPWNITGVPTLAKLEGGKITHRLTEIDQVALNAL
ncbi:hypothetical protein FIBSPDRAFT_1039232 [Athelia psychrophila]|uniref:Thioredoxin domain-containing protein n=1 Tax=Athelia psychrophila TaxID=1759441 RepID=A0A166S0K8_9AGAM|nr:hypothetical protein FIBSPDRAFT_1039232 [Fibularhizoctonia sp. CBS 109695]